MLHILPVHMVLFCLLVTSTVLLSLIESLQKVYLDKQMQNGRISIDLLIMTRLSCLNYEVVNS